MSGGLLISCPGCGLTGDLQCFLVSAEWKRSLKYVTELPHELHPHLIRYLSLFRNGERQLSSKRLERLLIELKALVSTGEVKIPNYETRPAPPYLWAHAMELTIEKRPERLKNHHYLRTTAWNQAKSLAAQAEARVEADRRSLLHRESGGGDSNPIGGIVGALAPEDSCKSCESFQVPEFCDLDYEKTKQLKKLSPPYARCFSYVRAKG